MTLRISHTILCGALAATMVGAPVATPVASAQAVGAENMWFADAYSTAFYKLDQRNHALVVRFEAGPKGGNPVVVRRVLADDAEERLTVDGTDHNRLRATLTVTRKAGVLTAAVTTKQLPRQQASN